MVEQTLTVKIHLKDKKGFWLNEFYLKTILQEKLPFIDSIDIEEISNICRKGDLLLYHHENKSEQKKVV